MLLQPANSKALSRAIFYQDLDDIFMGAVWRQAGGFRPEPERCPAEAPQASELVSLKDEPTGMLGRWFAVRAFGC